MEEAKTSQKTERKSGQLDTLVRVKPKLKLFVWDDFSPDYSGGLAIAIAKDEVEARKLIEKQRGYEVYAWGNLKTYPLTRRMAKSVSGGS